MKKQGYSQSISRLFTHSPSGAYLKKKYLQSCDQSSFNFNQISQSDSIFDFYDPNTFVYKQQQTTPRYSQIELTPPKFPIRKLSNRSQMLFRKVNKQMRQMSKQLPILSVCSQSKLINVNSNSESKILNSISKSNIQKQTTSRNCKRLENFKQRNIKYKNLTSISKSPIKQPQSLEIKKTMLNLNNKLKRLNKQNQSIKMDLYQQSKHHHLPNTSNKNINNLKAIQIKISNFVDKHIISKSTLEGYSKRKKNKKIQLDYLKTKDSREADSNLNQYIKNKLTEKASKSTIRIKSTKSTSILK